MEQSVVMMESENEWTVGYSTKAEKQAKRLKKEHPNVYAAAAALAKEIELCGPYRHNWPNYGPLKKGNGIPDGSFHCHVKKGKPTYVVCWCIENKKVKIVEIYYVGTHEKAPY